MGIISPKIRWTSLAVGLGVGGLTTLILYLAHILRPWAWGMVVGASVALITCGLMVLYLVVQAKRFAEAKERSGTNIVLTVPVEIGDNHRMLRGYLFLTPHVMHIYLWKRRPFLEAHFNRLEMKAQTTSVFETAMRVLPDGDAEGFIMCSPAMRELVSAMSSHGYTLSEVDQSTFIGEEAPQKTEAR